MESGDASNDEAPPCDPKSNNLMQKEWSKAISMLVDMETKDDPERGRHVQTYSTINLKIFFSCYVLLQVYYTIESWA